MKKVLVLADVLDNQNAGVHYYLLEFLSVLDKIKLEETEVTIIRKENLNQFDNIKTVTIKTIKYLPFQILYRLFVAIPLHAIYYKYDYVFEPAHFGPFNLPKKIKRVTFIHDLTALHFPYNHTFKGWFLQRMFLESILKKADYIFTNSRCTRDDVIKKFPNSKGKISYSYLGIPKRFDQLVPSKIDEFKGKFFLVVGSLEPRKGLVTILDAFQAFKSASKQEFKLVFAGPKGWKNDSFYEKLNTHPFIDDIIILGYVRNDKLKALYLKSQCLIYASEYEGFGFPIVEAAVNETISIVARNSSLIEVGEICGSSFFETSNSNELYKQMVNHSGVKIKPQNKQRIKEIFSWESHCREFLNRLNLQ